MMLAASTAALLLPPTAVATPFCSDPKTVTDPEIRAEIADLRKAAAPELAKPLLKQNLAILRALKVRSDAVFDCHRRSAITLDDFYKLLPDLAKQIDRSMAVVPDLQAREKALAEKKQETERGIVALKLDPATAQAVREGKIQIGMTSAVVRLSWGPPLRINETINASGTTAQWIYSASTLYFDTSGRLETIQRQR